MTLMKTNINPLAAIGVVVVVLVLLLAFMYRHTFRPSVGSMESLPPAERDKIMKAYGGGGQARPPAPQGGSSQPQGSR